MNELDKFADIFHRKLESAKQAQLRFAVCKSVNWDDKTMTAIGVSDDVPYEGVQLGFGYMDIKPKKETVCLIGILEGKEALSFLINAEDVELVEVKSDKIEINGGENGGMCKTPELKMQLDKLTARVDTIIDALNNAQATPQDGGSALILMVKTTLATITQKENFGNIENDKITH